MVFNILKVYFCLQTHTLWFEDYITKDEGLYTVTASNLCGSISYSVIVRILEDEQEYDWMVYRRSKQIVPRTKGLKKFSTIFSVFFRFQLAYFFPILS